MLAQEIIRKKRDRASLNSEEIESFVTGIAKKEVSDAQIAAFCMATFLNGMEKEECVALTASMASSGETISWDKYDLDGPVVDKHSTGGVGDKVSLMLAPLVAACGGYVPMISGRGLGHTGGTLDKMDSIPGYVTTPELESFTAIVKDAGCAIVGQTHELAPADRAIYAVRDVTSTVEDINLITASILSKKLAAGLDALVMDVKYGSGAFMRDYDDAKKLAVNIIEVAEGAGLSCRALMSDMNQVLGRTAGNAVEVREAIGFLSGREADQRLYEVVMSLAAEMLVMGKLAKDQDAALLLAKENLGNGKAAEVFARMVSDLGGPSDLIEKCDDYLPLAGHVLEVHSDETGIVEEIDTRQIGISIIALGGGRRVAEDTIDHSVGLADVAAIGETVGANDRPLAVIYGASKESVREAESIIKGAYKIAPPGTDVKAGPVIEETLCAP